MRNFYQEVRESMRWIVFSEDDDNGNAEGTGQHQAAERHANLGFHCPTYKLTSPQRETPWIMCRARDPNALVGYHIRRSLCVSSEAVSRVRAQIHFMMTIGNVERLRELARSRAKTFHIIKSATFLHLLDAFSRLQRANKDETILVAFDQHVQHPMHSIIEIDIGGTRVVSLDKAARTRTCKGMRGLVVDCRVRFHIDNDSRTIVPNEFCADQLTRASDRITFKKRRTDNLVHCRDSPYLMARCLLSISIVLSIGSASIVCPL